MDKRSEKEIVRFYFMTGIYRADMCAVARCLPFVWSETCVMHVNHVDGYPSKQLRNVWHYLALQNQLVADTMSTSVREEYAHFKDCKFNKVAIFNGII